MYLVPIFSAMNVVILFCAIIGNVENDKKIDITNEVQNRSDIQYFLVSSFWRSSDVSYCFLMKLKIMQRTEHFAQYVFNFCNTYLIVLQSHYHTTDWSGNFFDYPNITNQFLFYCLKLISLFIEFSHTI